MRLLPPFPRASAIPALGRAGIGLIEPLAGALVALVPDPVRSLAVATAEETLTWLVALSESVSDRQLELLLNVPPVRRLVLESAFVAMPRYVERTPVAGVEIEIRWRVSGPAVGGPDIYDLIVSRGRCRVARGETITNPALTITITPAELVRLASGRTSLMQSYLGGRLSLRGDILRLVRIASLFGSSQVATPGTN